MYNSSRSKRIVGVRSLSSDQVSGFAVLPKRWIVERTIAWPQSQPKACTLPGSPACAHARRLVLAPRPPSRSPPTYDPHCTRSTAGCHTSRDFVPWRFSDAGRRSAWRDHHSGGRKPAQQRKSAGLISMAISSEGGAVEDCRPISDISFQLRRTVSSYRLRW
jgi:hypothetical protein